MAFSSAFSLLALYLSVSFLLPTSFSSCSLHTCQLSDACSSSDDCAAGLYCGNCPAAGKKQTSCSRAQAIQPASIVKGLPFNRYTWLVTHNSFSNVNEPSTGVQRVTFYNQEDTVTNQLRPPFDYQIPSSSYNSSPVQDCRYPVDTGTKECLNTLSPENGVRGLMLDMYELDGDIWLCHSFQGQCYNFTAFEPAINTLKEVETFLTENPTEIVTIFIEDYVHTQMGLSKLFTNADLVKYLYPVSDMPANGKDWPTVTEMLTKNHRLIVFTSDSSKEASEGIAYQWRYLLENESGDPGMVPGSCPNRKESHPLNSGYASLFLQNHFPSIPVESEACKENSGALAQMVEACYNAAGNRMPNFIAVNFYMRSDGGGVFDIQDRINGLALCGCSTLAACQAGAPMGACKNTVPPSQNTTPGGNVYSGTLQFSFPSSSFSLQHVLDLTKLHAILLIIALLL